MKILYIFHLRSFHSGGHSLPSTLLSCLFVSTSCQAATWTETKAEKDSNDNNNSINNKNEPRTSQITNRSHSSIVYALETAIVKRCDWCVQWVEDLMILLLVHVPCLLQLESLCCKCQMPKERCEVKTAAKEV